MDLEHTLERRHPQRKLETGLITYTSTSVSYKRLGHLEHYNVESVWLEIKWKYTAPILFEFIYRNPDERAMWADNLAL